MEENPAGMEKGKDEKEIQEKVRRDPGKGKDEKEI